MIKDKVLRSFSRDRLESFFMGPIYPIVVAALVLCGYFFAVEYYLHFINMGLITLALCVCRSLRPTIIVLCSFVFQISREHTPSTNNVTYVPSDYYFTEGRHVALIISFVIVGGALVYFFVRNKLITLGALRSLPLLLPSALLAVAFVIGGLFSSNPNERSVGFALVQIVTWFVIFYLYVLGLKRERGSELLDYLVYVASVLAIILLCQLIAIFVVNGENMIDMDGSFIRGTVVYGWGVTNTAAQSLTVLIPVLFIGAMKEKHGIYYFVMATLAFVGSILNLSRTALVVGVPIYFAALIITFVKTKKKKLYAVEISVTAAVIAALIIAFREYTFPAFENYLIRGTADSGRFWIWDACIEAFCESPIFGKGFFGLSDYLGGLSNTTFIPFMAHNTPLHMLACCGIFGGAAYSYYRIATVIPFVKRPSTAKTFIGLALLSVLLGSLLENFVFYILPMFFYSVTFAVSYKLIEEEGQCAEVTLTEAEAREAETDVAEAKMADVGTNETKPELAGAEMQEVADAANAETEP